MEKITSNNDVETNTQTMVNDFYSLSGQVALITGGGSGIGLAIAKEFVEAGSQVVITGRRESVLKEAVNELGSNAIYVAGDITIAKDRESMISTVRDRFGSITTLVNNAGQNVKKAAAEVSDEDFDALLDTHVKASFALSREVAGDMMKGKGGSILFVSSMAALMGVPLVVGYSTAKTAVLGMTRALAAEWSPSGVRVNAIIPGWIETPMTQKAFSGDPERYNKVISRTPMKKMGQPKDIAMTARFLSSEAARFITGQSLAIDGGAAIGF